MQLRVADETLSSPARDGAETAVIVLAAADAVRTQSDLTNERRHISELLTHCDPRLPHRRPLPSCLTSPPAPTHQTSASSPRFPCRHYPPSTHRLSLMTTTPGTTSPSRTASNGSASPPRRSTRARRPPPLRPPTRSEAFPRRRKPVRRRMGSRRWWRRCMRRRGRGCACCLERRAPRTDAQKVPIVLEEIILAPTATTAAAAEIWLDMLQTSERLRQGHAGDPRRRPTRRSGLSLRRSCPRSLDRITARHEPTSQAQQRPPPLPPRLRLTFRRSCLPATRAPHDKTTKTGTTTLSCGQNSQG